MTLEELASTCSKIADKVISDNAVVIQNHISDSVLPSDNRDAMIGKMLANTIRLSTQLAVSSMLLALVEMEVIDPKDYKRISEAPNLTLLKFDD